MKWESVCRAAILETDWSKIEERILAADFAIAERLHEFSLNHGGTPTESEWILCEEAANGREGIVKAQELRPDVIVLDFVMPEMNGIQTARVLK